MPTDTARSRPAARNFSLQALACSLGFFGLLRLPWTDAHAVLPLTQVQAGVASTLFGPPVSPVDFTTACSGADALALCLAAVLAYPVQWRSRLGGAAGGIALILGINILRIGSLGRTADAPALFNALHLYVWPAVLTLAIAGYVFAWMRLADHPAAPPSPPAPARQVPPSPLASARLVPPSVPAPARLAPQPTRTFVVLTAAFIVLFAAASPFYLESASLLALGGFIAHAAAAILGGVGITAHAAANVLWTPRGGFAVTQECISTPLVPVYLAGICAYSTTWRKTMLGILATLPLFIALGIARLLVVALPDAVVTSPLFLVHAFYQLLLGAVVVGLAALWRYGGKAALYRAVTGAIVGVLFFQLAGPLYTRAVTYAAGAPLDDPQGAIAFLPAFQVGLYLALWVAAFVALGWRRFLIGLAVLEVTQIAGLLVLHAFTTYSGLTAHVRDIRGWAVAGPLVIVAAVANVARTRR